MSHLQRVPQPPGLVDSRWLSLVRILSYAPVKDTEPDDIDFTDTYISSEDDHEDDMDIALQMNITRTETTIRTKMSNIKHHAAQKKAKIKHNRSLRDWWNWYWQAPRSRFPFLYFLMLFLSCAALSVYWFMDNDSSFIICGGIGLSMCLYSSYKFSKSINLKKEVDKYRLLNLRFKLEHAKVEACIQRAVNAHAHLRHTKARLSKANDKNRKNLQKFEQMQNNMRAIGKEAIPKLDDLNKVSQNIKSKWREELLGQEREMLHAVWNRYARVHTDKTGIGLSKHGFKKFESMLPARYGQRFDRLGTFHAFAGDKEEINQNDFVNTLDTFALMETDAADIDFVLTKKRTVSDFPHVASFRFTTSRDLFKDM
eukprot:206610_1